jgi:hypothetical protein
MDIAIITMNFRLEVYGFGGIATNKDYAGTAFKLSGRMWEVVKAGGLKNEGKNIWVYDDADKVFAGVELDKPSDGNGFGLEKMTISLTKYAYFKHIGPYKLIKRAGQKLTNQLNKQAFEVVFPYIEIYGHWVSDETKLETELIMCLK